MVQKKINERMDILQNWMENNYHLKRPEVVKEHIESISKFWSVLSEEDRRIRSINWREITYNFPSF